LRSVEQALGEPSPPWDQIRETATIAISEMPGKSESRSPRAWLDQIVAGKHHLKIRGQVD